MRRRTPVNNDASMRALLNYYRAQRGGALAAMSGSKYQRGNGFGDIFKGVFRSVFPYLAQIVGDTGQAFLANAGNSVRQGRGYKESITGALAPTGKALVDNTIRTIAGRANARRSVSTPRRKAIRRRQTGRGQVQLAKRVYKRKKPMSQAKSKKQSKRRKTTLVSNF